MAGRCKAQQLPLFENPAKIMRQLVEGHIPPAARIRDWDERWAELERYCADPDEPSDVEPRPCQFCGATSGPHMILCPKRPPVGTGSLARSLTVRGR